MRGVDPDLLQSDLGAFAWISNEEILFGRYGQLWKVSAANGKPARVPGPLGDAGAFTLSPDRQTIAFVRRGNLWVGNVAAGTEIGRSTYTARTAPPRNVITISTVSDETATSSSFSRITSSSLGEIATPSSPVNNPSTCAARLITRSIGPLSSANSFRSVRCSATVSRTGRISVFT